MPGVVLTDDGSRSRPSSDSIFGRISSHVTPFSRFQFLVSPSRSCRPDRSRAGDHDRCRAREDEVNVNKQGVAIQGYDPVAYFTKGQPVRGNERIAATHGGATYHFASEENRKTFLADPDSYAPAYGGWCAYGVSKGKKYKVEPDAFSIVDGTLYLNYDKGVKKKWEKDIPGYLAKSDAQWPKIEHDAK